MSGGGKFDGSRGPPDISHMTSLKVDNLTYRTTMDDLDRHFRKFGDVGDIYIPKDRDTHESRGFAFVRFHEQRDAEDAMDGMDGKVIDGREVRVAMARYGRPSNQYDPRGRSGGGNRYRDDRGGSSYRDSRYGQRDRRSPPRRRSRSRSRSPRKRFSRSRSRSPRYHRRSASRSPAPLRSASREKSLSKSRSKSRTRSRTRSPTRSRSLSRDV